MGGLIAGGLVGSLLFGGGGGSFGLMDLVVLGLLGYLAMRKLRTPEAEPIRVEASSPGGAVHAPAARALDERGAAWPDLAPAGDQARRPAPLVDNAEAAQAAADIFRSVQSAWAARDMDRVAALVTPEMRASFQKDCDQLRARGRINRIDDITVRAAEVVEAWQEAGRNYATVRIEASLLDYTTDEKTGQVVEGSQTEPVTVEEHWTLTRAVWVKAWRLSAIQQPAPASS
jgi:predicted lipid-binding transport protein (Tim44 family)